VLACGGHSTCTGRGKHRTFFLQVKLAKRIIGLLVLFLAAACSAPPELVGIDNPEIPVAAVTEATQHRVFIATTREDSEVVGALFSELRAENLGLASVDVSIPPGHLTGHLERPKKLPPDPRKEFAIVEPTIYEEDDSFISALNKELQKRAPEDRSILLFVHGYNNTTSEAILRVGQFVEDSGFEGVPVLFTWASAGRFSRYVYDLNSALVARPMLLDATEIISRSIATDYHIFAHSMGSLLAMEAIVDSAQIGQFNQTHRLRNIILAAPDIDVDLFRSQVNQIETRFDRFFILLSEDDKALQASRFLAGGVPRVGAANAEALSQLGFNVIDLTAIKDSSTNSHSKFAGSPEVVKLIGLGLDSSHQNNTRRRSVLAEILVGVPIRIVRALE
jgi:esterase/lipase superfamily enzyme